MIGAMSPPPKSIDALWDARYRSKVIAYDGGSTTLLLAAADPSM